MSNGDRRAVRPRWICETGADGVEDERDGWDEYAKRLMVARKARAEEPEKEDEEEQDIDGEDLKQEHGQRKTKRMLDPKLPSQEEVRQHCLTHMPYRIGARIVSGDAEKRWTTGRRRRTTTSRRSQSTT